MMKLNEPDRVRLPARRTMLPAVTALAVGLSVTACGDVNTDSLHPLAEKDSLKPIGSKSKEAQTEEEPIVDSEQAKWPRPEIPAVVYPNGVETKLTQPGAELPFGEPGIVASSDAEGRLLVWSVTPYQGVDLSPGQVPLALPATAVGENYVCFAYDIAYLGEITSVLGDDDVVLGAGGVTGAAVAPPELVPGTTEGEAATRLVGGADGACSIPPESRLPAAQEALALNYPYARATVAAVKPGTEGTALPATLMYLFDEDIPGVAEAGYAVEPIIWG